MSTFAVGDKITIRHSKLLFDNGNDFLIDKKGVVTKIVMVGKRVVGAYIDVKIMRRTKSYFIPVCSIEGPVDVDRTRTLSILKSTIL